MNPKTNNQNDKKSGADRDGYKNLEINAQRVKAEKDTLNFRYNLLLIREAYRSIYFGMVSMSKAATSISSDQKEPKAKPTMDAFYKAVGITSDEYSDFLINGYISENKYNVLTSNLKECGLPKRYIGRTEKVNRVLIDKDLAFYMKEYITPPVKDTAKEKEYFALLRQYREDTLSEIRLQINTLASHNPEKTALLMMTVYLISQKDSDSTEKDLQLAYEVLHKLVQATYTEQNLKSNAFAQYVTELAKSVNSIESEFPEFYAVAQQLKEEKTPQSLMNEIYKNLEQLNKMEITANDAKSDACINMMEKISASMIKISSAMK